MGKKRRDQGDMMERIQVTRMRWILFYVFAGIFVLIVIGTLSVVFFGIGEPTEKERNILFSVFIVEIGVAVLAIFKLLFNLKKKPEARVIDIAGKYEYELIVSDNKTRYRGECYIKQEGRRLSFNGERKKVFLEDKEQDVSVHWFSNWSELCLDNKVRLDYSVSMAGGMRGYAILDVAGKVSESMVGEFHLVDVSHLYGTVKFKKLRY